MTERRLRMTERQVLAQHPEKGPPHPARRPQLHVAVRGGTACFPVVPVFVYRGGGLHQATARRI